jgi:acylphosphatase
VRNCLDGSVEALVQGPPDRVEELIDWARRGPPASRVDDVRVDLPGDSDDLRYTRFELRRTA